MVVTGRAERESCSFEILEKEVEFFFCAMSKHERKHGNAEPFAFALLFPTSLTCRWLCILQRALGSHSTNRSEPKRNEEGSSSERESTRFERLPLLQSF